MPGARMRYYGDYVLYAAGGEEVSVRVGFGQVGNYDGSAMPVVVTSPSGEEVANVPVPCATICTRTVVSRCMR